MEKQPLAIASVPRQSFGSLFDSGEAMRRGTIFQELSMPFFAAEEKPEGLCCPGREQTEREQLLSRIGEAAFILDDLTLYLDTHSQDPEALALYREKTSEREALSRQFAEQFYPLRKSDAGFCRREAAGFCWQMGPLPWEGGCGHVAL